jgi:xylitol oxidase
LCPWLHEQGYALHNLASLPHISIIGACSTATHGSGVGNGNLATAISGLEMVDADGSLMSLSRETTGDFAGDFAGAFIGLGALGVVTTLTLDLEPAFDMKQRVYLDLPVGSLFEHFDDILSSAYSVSLFTDYGSRVVNQIWVKQRLDDETADLDLGKLGARPAEQDVHPISGADPIHCTRQMGVDGPWYERLPHFRMAFTPSSGEELQAEYIVPREHGAAAYRALQSLADAIQPLLLTSEVRTIAEDDLWLSMNYHRPSVAFHFTLKQDSTAVEELLPMIELALEPFNPRPHWGKLFAMSSDRLDRCYPKLRDFRDLLEQFDPNGKFRNQFLEETILPSVD